MLSSAYRSAWNAFRNSLRLQTYDRVVDKKDDESFSHRALDDVTFVRQSDIVSVTGSNGLMFSEVQHVTRDHKLHPIRVHTADKRIYRIVFVASRAELIEVGSQNRGVVWRADESGRQRV